MIAKTEYERIKRIIWTLDSHDVDAALREYVRQKGPFAATKPARSFTVELTESGGAEVIWENVEDATS